MTVHSFDSWEEMQEHMAASLKVAKSRIQDFQRPLMDGKHHWFMRVVKPGDEMYLLVGEIFDIEEQHAKNLIKYADDYEPGEAEDELQNVRDRLQDGFVFRNVFSKIVPYGELGDTHVATMLEITKENFKAIKALNYDISLVRKDAELRLLYIEWIAKVAYQ